MRLKSEEFTKGQYYHLFNHSITEQFLFRDKEDYLTCLALIKRFYNQNDYSILAYCLMPNHYHFLIYQNTDFPIYTYFNKIWNNYSRYYNKKYNRHGTLFAGKLQHIGIKNSIHLVYLCAYIHLNPVHANLVKTPEQWQWSNYPEWIGIRDNRLIDRQIVETLFKSPSEYKNCISNFLPSKLDKSFRLDFE